MSRLAPDDEWHATVTALLRAVAGDGFTFRLCGRPDPLALVASYHWDGYVDLLTITSPTQVTAARAIKTPGFDVFNPRSVVWAFGNDAEPTLRALLDLMHPDHPDHPAQQFPAPQVMAVPADLQRPVTVKPPEPAKADRRERRLKEALNQRQETRVACAAFPGTHGDINVSDHLRQGQTV